MPTGTTFSRTVKPSVNCAVPPSSTSADIYLNFVELFSSIQLRGSFLPARLESLFLRVRWLEDAPERRGCGGGGGGGRIGNGARVERRRRRRRRRAGPNGVNSPGGGGGGGQDPEGEAAAEPGSRLRWKPGLSAAEGFCGGRERTS
ncbi:AT-rich interactive domain-containing protein 1A-like [Orcinus orca]|uniref:AT-rich interactive domain-containing protein 1A-like n=1 Tax=Orcinus orca TaxID=9733 RepID=UPI002111E45B|nr:AT-rich interactive domain-containing protein 1A-like [Orcinus orca]